MEEKDAYTHNQEADEVPDRFVVTDTLDLHGFFPEQISEIVHAFIDHALAIQIHYLKIIHGKGKSRLKFEVYRTLQNHPHVVHFKDAPPDLGGWGVTIVELDTG